MDIYYFDKFGNKMSMTVEEQSISIPVIIRFHKKLGDCKIRIVEDNWDLKDMERNKRKNSDKFEFYTANLICPSLKVGDKDEWVLSNLSNMPAEYAQRFNIDWVKAYEFWHRTRCRRDSYTSLEPSCSLNTTFYYQDGLIDRHINSTIHLFGEGIILSKNISNCLIFNHGNYEVR